MWAFVATALVFVSCVRPDWIERLREQSDVAPSRRLALANRIAAALMPGDRRRRVRRLLARLLLAISLAICLGCAKQDWIDRTLVTVDVTGTWYGTITSTGGAYAGTQELWLDLEQAGSKVKGAARFKPDQGFAQSGPIEGTVSGDHFTYRLLRGSSFIELTVSGDEMAGLFSGRPISFHRVDTFSSR